MLLNKTFYSHSAFLHSSVQWVALNKCWVPNPRMDYHPTQRGLEIILVTSCFRNWYIQQSDGSRGSYADFAHLCLYEQSFQSSSFYTKDRIRTRNW